MNFKTKDTISMTGHDDQSRIDSDIEKLIDYAHRLGVTARAILPDAIIVDEELAKHCREPRCENFGSSAQCPPHVSGPSGFRDMTASCLRALVIAIDVPSDILFSSARHEAFRTLHEISAEIESAAISMGYAGSKAFAGGSCKQIFCKDHSSCNILKGAGSCRNPGTARPSMSGYGINVSELLKSSGMRLRTYQNHAGGQTATSTICGLVMLG